MTIPSMALRVCGVLALTLGIIFWTGNFDALQPIHITLGILVVASLLWLTVLFARAGRGGALTATAAVVGLTLVLVGFGQQHILTDTASHWVIQVAHLLLGLAALALGEIMTARLRRAAPAA